MRFQLLAALTFAVSAIASPTGNQARQGTIGGDVSSVSVVEANKVCGNNNLDMNCCNDVDISGDAANTAGGLLGGVLSNSLNGLGLFTGCSKISVTGLIGVADLLDSKCKANVACCQGDQNQNGLVNVGLPCVALSGLL